ncbi:MAG: hypothetical protein RIC55_06405 [Pirellulaceae bacterium]
MDETTSTPNNEHPPADEARVKELQEEARTAKEAMLHAREQLRQAEQSYCQAQQRLLDEQGEPTSYGEIIDQALGFVRKHPGIGVTAAAAMGFVVGRILRRW